MEGEWGGGRGKGELVKGMGYGMAVERREGWLLRVKAL